MIGIEINILIKLIVVNHRLKQYIGSTLKNVLLMRLGVLQVAFTFIPSQGGLDIYGEWFCCCLSPLPPSKDLLDGILQIIRSGRFHVPRV